MSWIAVDCGLPEHPKILELPNDSARYGWIVVLTVAKRQHKPGTFASEAHFRGVVHGYSKHLPQYLSTGLLERHDDGSLHVHDWKRYQWAAAKARQREDIEETRRGQDEDKNETSEGHETKDVLPLSSSSPPSRARSAVPVLSMSTEEGVQGEEPDAAVEFQRRTGQFPGPKILDWLNELADAHGEDRLVKAIAAMPMAGLKVPDYLRSVRDRLRSEDHLAEKAEAADEQRRLAEKRRTIQVVPLPEDVSPEEARRLAEEHMAKYPSGRSA